MVWEKTGYTYLSSLLILILSHMTALKDDTADHILSLFISLIKFHCTMGYQRWCFVDPQHLSYSFHLSQMLYIYHLYFFFLLSPLPQSAYYKKIIKETKILLFPLHSETSLTDHLLVVCYFPPALYSLFKVYFQQL